MRNRRRDNADHGIAAKGPSTVVARCGSATPSLLRSRPLSLASHRPADSQARTAQSAGIELHPLVAPGDSAVKSDLRDRRGRIAFGDHRIDRHRIHRRHDHCVADRVEPEGHRRFDLVVIPNVVGITSTELS